MPVRAWYVPDCSSVETSCLSREGFMTIDSAENHYCLWPCGPPLPGIQLPCMQTKSDPKSVQSLWSKKKCAGVMARAREFMVVYAPSLFAHRMTCGSIACGLVARLFLKLRLLARKPNLTPRVYSHCGQKKKG